jgi:hypothetical protein
MLGVFCGPSIPVEVSKQGWVAKDWELDIRHQTFDICTPAFGHRLLYMCGEAATAISHF